MKSLICVALILMIGGGALAEDTFGLWHLVNGEYVNWIPVEQATDPFELSVTVHDPSVFSIGGYEVGMDVPDEVLVLGIGGPNGWTNYGDPTNQIVGFQTPLIVQTEIGMLCEMRCLAIAYPDYPAAIIYHGSNPASIPGHDGPVLANGINPDELMACGYVNGHSSVFFFGWPMWRWSRRPGGTSRLSLNELKRESQDHTTHCMTTQPGEKS